MNRLFADSGGEKSVPILSERKTKHTDKKGRGFENIVAEGGKHRVIGKRPREEKNTTSLQKDYPGRKGPKAGGDERATGGGAFTHSKQGAEKLRVSDGKRSAFSQNG